MSVGYLALTPQVIEQVDDGAPDPCRTVEGRQFNRHAGMVEVFGMAKETAVAGPPAEAHPASWMFCQPCSPKHQQGRLPNTASNQQQMLCLRKLKPVTEGAPYHEFLSDLQGSCCRRELASNRVYEVGIAKRHGVSGAGGW